MTTNGVSRRVLRNWARRVTKGVTRNFVVASRTSPGSSRAGRMMREISSPTERSLTAASSPERAREKEFSTSLIIISSILAQITGPVLRSRFCRGNLARCEKKFPYSFTRYRVWYRCTECSRTFTLVGPLLSCGTECGNRVRPENIYKAGARTFGRLLPRS